MKLHTGSVWNCLWDMHFKDLLGSIARVGYCILVQDILSSATWPSMPNPNPNALHAMQGGSLYHFYDGLWYDPAGTRTHDLPYERQTHKPLRPPNTVATLEVSRLIYISSVLLFLEAFYRYHNLLETICFLSK